jgi:DNA-binding CsgD family transcriptional regulator
MRPGSGTHEREWLELAADVMAAPLIELPVERIALQLVRTFDAVGAAFSFQRNGGIQLGGLFPVWESFAGHRSEIEGWGVRQAPRIHPLLQYYRATGTSGFMQVADVPERFTEPGAVAAWYERTRHWGCADQLALPVLMRANGHRAFVVGRAEPFSTGELEFARRVWQLLVGLDRQVQAFGGLQIVPDVASDFRLTPRELTVLGLLVEGLTAGAIGRRLAIGERTVQKHLEHAYTKLGVGDRLSAVLRAQQLGLLPISA